ncbi:MAG: hypothetical protein J7605_13940 [Variovorax sp.]|nr:hypothetical protein [Variovorax sp.]
MKVIIPTPITPATLSYSNVVDEALPAWDMVAAFIVGDQVIHERRIWEAVQDGTGVVPRANPEYWLDIGATNTWAMFDQRVGSQSKGPTPIVVKLRAGIISDVAILNVDAELVEVALDHAGETVWRDERDMRTSEVITDWFEYFFAQFRARTDVSFANVPPYLEGELTVTISKPVNDVAVGEIIVGQSRIFGVTQISPHLSINDYSRKEVDAWGDYFVVERAFSKRMSANVLVDNILVDEVCRLLAKYRATPLIWNGNDERFGALIVYGFYKSFSVDIAHYTHSFCTLEIEGLT